MQECLSTSVVFNLEIGWMARGARRRRDARAASCRSRSSIFTLLGAAKVVGSRKSEVGSRKSEVGSNGVPRRPSLPDPYGTSDREGTARRNWHGWTSGAGMVWLPLVPRVERARGPPLTSFWRFGVLGQTRARQGGNGGWRRLAERAVVGATECAPYPAQAPYLTHACARDTQVPSTFRGCCSERAQQREAVCQAGRRRRGWQQQRRRGRRQQRGRTSA